MTSTTVSPPPDLSTLGSAAVPINGAWFAGIVSAADGDRFQVHCGTALLTAGRAASCLLEPMQGDTVACLTLGPDQVWVLAVLQREHDGPDVLRARRGLRIETPKFALEATRIEVDATESDIGVARASITGHQWRFVGAAVKVVGATLSTVFDRVTHYSRHHLRQTDGLDRVQATQLECEASQLLHLSGQQTLINGDSLVKARGGQIHFG